MEDETHSLWALEKVGPYTHLTNFIENHTKLSVAKPQHDSVKVFKYFPPLQTVTSSLQQKVENIGTQASQKSISTAMTLRHRSWASE